MKQPANPIGICTWSLDNDPDRVFHTLEATGLSHIHLGIFAIDMFKAAIERGRVRVSATMVGFPQEDYSTLATIRRTGGIMPDDCWERNRDIVLDAIDISSDLGVGLLSFHGGFIDHSDEAGYRKFCTRMRELADAARLKGVVLLLETGQEVAEDLRCCLEDLNHPAVGVNFDPANMILYGKGDPIAAVRTLAPWIRHVHIKDAVPAAVPGEWGIEVPWGNGDVEHGMFIQTLAEIGFAGALAVEREAGKTRENDIKLAVRRLGGEI
ncbi:MAG: sugar phosphate isomerase/epimerase [Kiritimatiellales bacterium]|nr:sugar phosphate isomerase/epimerase [Kiritimatiellales bacterium]